jgi:hypothetical protein
MRHAGCNPATRQTAVGAAGQGLDARQPDAEERAGDESEG